MKLLTSNGRFRTDFLRNYFTMELIWMEKISLAWSKIDAIIGPTIFVFELWTFLIDATEALSCTWQKNKFTEHENKDGLCSITINISQSGWRPWYDLVIFNLFFVLEHVFISFNIWLMCHLQWGNWTFLYQNFQKKFLPE